MALQTKTHATHLILFFLCRISCIMDLHKPAASHVVLIASPGLGHLIPIIELGKRFVLLHNFKATILAVTSQTSHSESQILKSATTHSLCNIIQIPPPDISTILPSNPAVATRICVTMREAIPSIRTALSTLPLRPSSLIVDVFSTESITLAKELNIPNFVYIASHAWFLSLLVYSPMLDIQIEGQYVDQKEPLKIPGCNPVQPEDVVDPMLDRNDLQYKEYLTIGINIHKCDAVLVNTWEEFQRKDLEALRSGLLNVPVYGVGPIVRPPESETGCGNATTTESVIQWLDKQPSESVVYVSFGSGGTVSFEQMKELALGLELSGQRFVWVVRAPTGEAADAAFFTTGTGSSNNDGYDYLPEGFVERTKEVGMLVPDWAPQVTVLRHSSIGGFLSHCGWGSVLESLTSGVPMIAWPLYAEQKMNATMLAGEDVGVAVKPAVLPAKKVVGREEVASMVREVMGNYGKRERVREVKVSGDKALLEGGSSHKAMFEVAKIIDRSKNDFVRMPKMDTGEIER